MGDVVNLSVRLMAASQLDGELLSRDFWPLGLPPSDSLRSLPFLSSMKSLLIILLLPLVSHDRIAGRRADEAGVCRHTRVSVLLRGAWRAPHSQGYVLV